MIVLLLVFCILPAGWDLTSEATPVQASDRQRFPPPEYARDALKFAEAHNKWLDTRHRFSAGSPDWKAWKAEHATCLRAWALLVTLDGGYGPMSPECTRRNLENLRSLLGPEAYAAGQMPPPCPWWLFQER